MSEPSVCAVMLTANRPEMAKRAVECFRLQTYPEIARHLLICDTGSDTVDPVRSDNITKYLDCAARGMTVGELRNKVNSMSLSSWDILIHWDDDDWSHPNRIAEQVALLQSSGADCVGYREMLFWRESVHYPECGHVPGDCSRWHPGEAWLYSNPDPTYALGTSLCYWRRTWQARPFEATSQGEDERFIRGLKCVGERAFRFGSIPDCMSGDGPEEWPRMIARIHKGNTSTGYRPELMERESRKPNPMWQRVPARDEHCRSVMA